jgi:hypothetical protein
MALAIRLIDTIGAGPRHSDQPELRKPGEHRTFEFHLVGDGDPGFFEPLHHLLGGRLRIFGEDVRERRAAEGCTVKKDDLCMSKGSVCLVGVLVSMVLSTVLQINKNHQLKRPRGVGRPKNQIS